MEVFLDTVERLAPSVVDGGKKIMEHLVDEGKKSIEYLRSTGVKKLRDKVTGCLNRSNIGRAVLNVLHQAGIKPEQNHRIKMAIQEMVDLEGVPVISLDVLDEMMEEIQLEVELECDQVSPDLRPGDIIYETA